MKQENLIKLLKELIRNSKRSDRELAKAVNLSQPTVTRLRKLADKYVRSYTIVPEFGKIGYELLAFTFVKARTYEKTKVEENIRLVKEWYKKHPNVIFASDGEGLGKDGVIVSVHKNYSKYADFMRDFILNFVDFASDVQSFLVSLKTGIILKPFDLTYLADDINNFQ
ncbi:MAG: Lrp/AsnC family transcriptional regulator [Candidatus Bathyarchaeota archaeon]|nr:Lrp/AsnC family transcriptional regulator [Candidatus Bathyarchaeota archaeon]